MKLVDELGFDPIDEGSISLGGSLEPRYTPLTSTPKRCARRLRGAKHERSREWKA